MTPKYPLLCGFQEVVVAKDFIATVAVSGKALAVEEPEGGWWIYGVNPGGISASGETLQAAHAQLRETFRQYLFDVADEARGFDAFKSEVHRFFQATNQPTDEEWKEAVAEVRRGGVNLADVAKAPAESPREIEIALVAVRNVQAPALAA